MFGFQGIIQTTAYVVVFFYIFFWKVIMIYTVTFNPSIDYVVRMNTDICFGNTNRSCSESYYVGGKGNNVSFILKQLGVESVALGFAGGFTGDAIIDGLRLKGLKSDYIILKEGNSRINIKLQNANGIETEINANGPVIDSDSLDKLFDKIESLEFGDTIVLAGSIPGSLPKTIYEDILSRISGKGVLSVVDASGELLRKVLRFNPFLIKPNKQELAELFDIDIKSDADIDKAVSLLKKEGARNVIVSLGAEGAYLYTENGDRFYSPAVRGNVKNCVGAGDSMVAGFIAGYARYSDYSLALKLGTAAGAATAFSDDLATGEYIEEIFADL